MKKILADYFSFSKKERIAVLILLFLIAGFIALPYFFGVKKKPAIANTALQQQISSLQNNKQNTEAATTANTEGSSPYRKEYAATGGSPVKFELFKFDPNTLDEKGWLRLGIREKTAKTILNYRNKGGKFKTPEDLRKIWGLRKEEADRIIPYAVIVAAQGSYQPSASTYNNRYTAPNKGIATMVDINTATPEDFKKLPGIYGSLPYRIIKFRHKLGGFITVQQVKETWGMTDSVFTSIAPYLQLKNMEIKKLNINTASEFELNAHPYIDKYTAKAIIAYRVQHGSFQSLLDLKKITIINDETFNKISPYLAIQ